MNGTWFQHHQVPSFAACLLGLILSPTASGGQAFDPEPTGGIERSAGSAAAREPVFKNRRAPGRSELEQSQHHSTCRHALHAPNPRLRLVPRNAGTWPLLAWFSQ